MACFKKKKRKATLDHVFLPVYTYLHGFGISASQQFSLNSNDPSTILLSLVRDIAGL